MFSSGVALIQLSPAWSKITLLIFIVYCDMQIKRPPLFRDCTFFTISVFNGTFFWKMVWANIGFLFPIKIKSGRKLWVLQFFFLNILYSLNFKGQDPIPHQTGVSAGLSGGRVSAGRRISGEEGPSLSSTVRGTRSKTNEAPRGVRAFPDTLRDRGGPAAGEGQPILRDSHNRRFGPRRAQRPLRSRTRPTPARGGWRRGSKPGLQSQGEPGDKIYAATRARGARPNVAADVETRPEVRPPGGAVQAGEIRILAIGETAFRKWLPGRSMVAPQIGPGFARWATGTMQSDDVSVLFSLPPGFSCFRRLGSHVLSWPISVVSLRNRGFQNPDFRAWGSHVSTRDLQPAASAAWTGRNSATQSTGLDYPVPGAQQWRTLPVVSLDVGARLGMV